MCGCDTFCGRSCKCRSCHYWNRAEQAAPVQQGWQCPVCGQVNAPWMAACFGNHTVASSATVRR